MTLLGALSPSALAAGGLAGVPALRAAFEKIGLPHRRMEAFKWSDFRAAVPGPLRAAEPAGAPAPLALEAFQHTLANGVPAAPAGDLAGVTLRSAPGAPLPEAFADHPLALYATGEAQSALEISVDVAVATPVLLRHVAGVGASAGRVVIEIAAGAALTLIETFEAGAESFAVDLLDVKLGAGARLERYVVQDGDAASVTAALAHVEMAADARVTQTAISFGGRLSRLETQIACHGPGARIDLKSASLVSDARHADHTSRVAHAAPGIGTRQLHKAVLKDRSRSIFQGKFLVARAAQKTDARMQARALLLSENAEADCKPELEIYADDVQCAHGAATGALDQDALFYLMQRGLSPAAARALLVEAFLGEVFDSVARADLADLFRARAARWLEGA